ncbi:gem-associated protein 8 [Hydra vulgaris]|uniref:gem-associated protein 8 n=1 Tax=Hydra vulgaris TaxID=6087 RepID=UPI0001925C7E|nr:gem-associated protein 8 [Hydra vulgaris]
MENAYLSYMTTTCNTQAKWHLEQYKRFSFYSEYYSNLKANKESCHTHVNNSRHSYDHPSLNSGNSNKLKSKNKKRKNQKKEECESEFELDQQFVDFLRQSSEFKKKRDADKIANLKENDPTEDSVEYVDVLQKGPDGTVLPPTALNRKQIYEEKYGNSGTLVLSLETALQWKFNKFIDKSSPCLWPALPIRF